MSDMQPAGLLGSGAQSPNLISRYRSRFDDAHLARAIFFGLLAGALGVLALDLRELTDRTGWRATNTTVSATLLEPVLPLATRTNSPTRTNDERRFVTTDETLLDKPMTFILDAGGVLTAEGGIDPGASTRLATELEAWGQYVKVVSLNSPGGSLDDAMAMAKLIRERGIATEVADGALCASSCPLILAGGKTRAVAPKAAIGVHQFYAAAKADASPEQVMADVQMTTARISRHLMEMGINPALWLHALDTPPQSLYYFSADEMARYGLVTSPLRTAQR